MIEIEMFPYRYDAGVIYHSMKTNALIKTTWSSHLNRFMIGWLKGRKIRVVDRDELYERPALAVRSSGLDEELFNIIGTVKTVRGLFMRARKMLAGGQSRRKVIDFLRGEAVKKKLER